MVKELDAEAWDRYTWRKASDALSCSKPTTDPPVRGD
jgi:hypothetical protein